MNLPFHDRFEYPSMNTMQRRFRRVCSAVKENCSVGYAKILAAGGYSDVDLIVIKATAPNDSPLPEKYVQELLKIFAFSPPSHQAFFRSFSTRFRNTRCWRVGLKCLLLLHRLLQSVPENAGFRFELHRSRSNGSICLHNSRIGEDEDHASFVRSYALFLDEAMNCDFFWYTKPENESSNRINEIKRLIEITTQIQTLIERVIDCRPEERAVASMAVQSATKLIIRESFVCYGTVCKHMDSIEERLVQLPYRSCVAAIGVYKTAAGQADRLSELYDWCRGIGVCGCVEIDGVPEWRIEAVEGSVGKMWEMTESSSSSECAAAEMGRSVVVTARSEWEVFEGSDNGVKPLIEVEEEESNWEDLLEASSASFVWDQNGECYNTRMEFYHHHDNNNNNYYNTCSINPFHHWIQA